MSNGTAATSDVRVILMQQFPNAKDVVKSTNDEDRSGVDWWVLQHNGDKQGVDTKIRETDFAQKGEDDLALETWSVVEKQVIGWTRDANKRCDYILWLWKDTGRWMLAPFPMLCKVFVSNWEQWKAKYKTRKQYTPGRDYHSECTFVPRLVVWREIYNEFGGQLSVTKPQQFNRSGWRSEESQKHENAHQVERAKRSSSHQSG
jgi:hypothetical protein